MECNYFLKFFHLRPVFTPELAFSKHPLDPKIKVLCIYNTIEGGLMAHRTQLYLDDSQGRSIQNYAKDPFFKLQGLFDSKTPDLAENFDDYLYGDKK